MFEKARDAMVVMLLDEGLYARYRRSLPKVENANDLWSILCKLCKEETEMM